MLRAMNLAYQSGLKLSSQGRHADAIAQFEQALALQPDDPKVLFAGFAPMASSIPPSRF